MIYSFALCFCTQIGALRCLFLLLVAVVALLAFMQIALLNTSHTLLTALLGLWTSGAGVDSGNNKLHVLADNDLKTDDGVSRPREVVARESTAREVISSNTSVETHQRRRFGGTEVVARESTARGVLSGSRVVEFESESSNKSVGTPQHRRFGGRVVARESTARQVLSGSGIVESEFESSNTSVETSQRRRFGGRRGSQMVSSHHASFANETERFMIYQCIKFCGGWADRLKGIITAYIIATLTNRTFGIQIVDNECTLTNHLKPNEVNWDIPQSVDLTTGSGKYYKLDHARFYENLAWVDLDEIFPSRVVFFKSNLDRYDKIKPNKLYRKQLEWMQPLSRAEIFARIYRKLFKFSPEVRTILDRTLKLARPTENGRLICGHVRFAGNAGNFPDTQRRHTTAHGKTLLNFLQTFDPASSKYNISRAGDVFGTSAAVKASNVRFFVTSDSTSFLDQAEDVFGDRLIRTEGRVVHMDRPNQIEKAGCDSFTKVLVDQHLLSTCDVLVVSKSNLSGQAAYLRGTDRGLYCLFMNGQLEKCSAGKLRELYVQNV